ncbi:hypothetical protein MAPG_08502 [Magnaporthiopsis poae ATCC 64411]|uniref:DNA2/NAM7 helicase-like C-terminal domain-containing protein n=1 Tax=Magnaporthiopsis poae (strain ATCC 64411 / 73-15) TaxID=644358 RepID=A0A0C4E7I9_MAGP6|nr:hypothetical protein MAPG_08502 [Magnaporthiopsis poae ATCC 64411]
MLPDAPPCPPARAHESDQDQFQLKQAMQRALFRGCGFDEWQRPSNDLADAMARVNILSGPVAGLVRLPREKLLPDDPLMINVIFEEIIEKDRVPMGRYLSACPWGLVAITGAAGTGKTTALCVATMCLYTRARSCVFGTGPSNVAVTNFASRFDLLARNIAAKYNRRLAEMGDEAPAPLATLLVVRGYHLSQEYDGLMHLLGQPRKPQGRVRSRWNQHLSPSFWLLLALGSPLVRDSTPADSYILDKIRGKVLVGVPGHNFAKLVREEISWAEFEALGEDSIPDRKCFEGWCLDIIANAQALFTTPALVKVTTQANGGAKGDTPFAEWWLAHADVIAVDEAANMHLHDLFQTWGNRLLPCILAGDERQLLPTIMSAQDVHDDGTPINRFAKTAVSALAFVISHGHPIWRQRQQFRMDMGMFDLARELFYSDLPMTYGATCAIDNPARQLGVEFEQFVRRRYPGLKAPSAGTHWPFFLHADGARVHRDPLTGSRKSEDQNNVALRLLADFVRQYGGNKRDLVRKLAVLSPYKSNVDLLNEMRRRFEFEVLEEMRPCATIDGVQGQEADIVVIVFGTDTKSGGPGFTAQPNRLNVSITRQKSGLALVGDIFVCGHVAGEKRKVMENEDGTFTNVGHLRELHRRLQQMGRVATARVDGR